MILIVMHIVGDVGRAFNFFNAAIKFKPRSSAVHFQKGRYYHEMNQNDSAIQSYKEALRIRPGHWKACHALIQATNSIIFPLLSPSFHFFMSL